MNDIQRRIGILINDIDEHKTDWNEIVRAILVTDLKFWEYEKPTLHRNIYSMLNQLLDILNLERNEKYWAIPYEFADLLSMAIGYMCVYGDPAKFTSHRVKVNSTVKTEKAIVDTYEERWQKLGKKSINVLLQLLRLHEHYDYFKSDKLKIRTRRKASKRWEKQ